MMSDKIPGVPEGWELVHAMRRATKGEWYIDNDGTPHLQHMSKSVFPHPIIRKIEKPARYRPFATAEEFKPHRDRWIRRKDNGHEMRTTSFCDSVHFTGNDGEAWETMLADYIFDDDGTPFGVRIDE